jgi:hypothetical protein
MYQLFVGGIPEKSHRSVSFFDKCKATIAEFPAADTPVRHMNDAGGV